VFRGAIGLLNQSMEVFDQHDIAINWVSLGVQNLVVVRRNCEPCYKVINVVQTDHSGYARSREAKEINGESSLPLCVNKINAIIRERPLAPASSHWLIR